MGEEKEKVRKRCKNCKAFVADERFEYCATCHREIVNELHIINKYDNMDRAVEFYKLKLIDMFRKHTTVILVFTEENSHIAHLVIEGTKHMGYQQKLRSRRRKRDTNPPYLENNYVLAPLELLSQVRAFNKDRNWYD